MPLFLPLLHGFRIHSRTTRRGSHRRVLRTQDLELLETRRLLAVFPAFTPVLPLGGLAYTSSVEDSVSVAAEIDRHEIALPAGENVSLIVRPVDAMLRPRLEVRDANDVVVASTEATAPGTPAVLNHQVFPATAGYSLVVLGLDDTTGGYSAEAYLNATLEGIDSDAASPVSMTPSQGPANLQRFAAVGRSTPGIQSIVEFSDNFDSGPSAFTIDNTLGSGNGLWHYSTGRSADGLSGHSAPGSLYFGRNETSTAGGDYSVGTTGGGVTTPAITLTAGRDYSLNFSHFLETEGSAEWDVASILIDAGGGFVPLVSTANGTLPVNTQGTWAQVNIDLTPFAGSVIQLRFTFDTIDGALNDFEGWFLDDVSVRSDGFVAESDLYSVDLSAALGKRVDFLLAGSAGDDFSAATLELIAQNGATVLATGVRDPLGSTTTNVDLTIAGQVISTPGVYFLRVSNSAPGAYSVVATAGATFDLEPNDATLDALRALDETRLALGYAEATSGSLNAIPGKLPYEPSALDPAKRDLLAQGTIAMHAFLPTGVSSGDFAAEYQPKVHRAPYLKPGGQGAEQIPLPEAEPNNSLEVAQEVRLGFDPGLGESTAFEITGRVGVNPITLTIREDDGSIPLANPTGLSQFQAVRANGNIGNGPQTNGDYDWYQVPSVASGQHIIADVDRTAGSTLDSVLGIYNSAGTLLAFNDDSGGLDSYLDFTVSVPGDYYVVVRGFGTTTGFQSDPFNPASGLGAGSTGAYRVTIGIDTSDQADFFRLPLEAGDVLSAGLSGSPTALTLLDAQGNVLVRSASGQNLGFILPPSSPLHGIADSAQNYVSWVVDATADYFLRVDQGTGAYNLNLQALRPALETAGEGAKQILFLDFDGATGFDASIWGGLSNTNFSPLEAFLPGWGLDPEDDYDAVVDSIVGVVAENLSLDPRLNGGNGDFALTGNFGDFDIEIRNSRDHADPFGQPNVSRVIVGGTIAQLGLGTIGIAESIDVGNFDTTESAIVLLDLLSAPGSNPNSLNQFTITPSKSIIDLIGVGVGNITAHEAGHFFGNFHTYQYNSAPNIMDQGGNLDNTIGLIGAVWGDANDKDVDFGKDMFVPNEGFEGVENTLDVIAFGLPSGGVVRGPAVVAVAPTAGIVPNLYTDEVSIEFSKALDGTSAVNAANYRFVYAGLDGAFGTMDDHVIGIDPSYDGDRTVDFGLDSADLPFAPGKYRVEILKSIIDTQGRHLNARADNPGGFDTIHLFEITAPKISDRYTVNLAVGEALIVSTETPYAAGTTVLSTLDPELVVFGPSGDIVAFDRDSAGDGRNARIQVTALVAGQYQLQVAATSGEGPYILRLSAPPSPADFDQDGDLDCDDINALSTAIATLSSDLRFDLNNDASVGRADLDMWRMLAGETNLGAGRVYPVADANLDGAVDGADFNIWNANKFTLNSQWCAGDFTADGAIDGSDFGLWNANKFTMGRPADTSIRDGIFAALSSVEATRRPTKMNLRAAVVATVAREESGNG